MKMSRSLLVFPIWIVIDYKMLSIQTYNLHLFFKSSTESIKDQEQVNTIRIIMYVENDYAADKDTLKSRADCLFE